MSMSSLSRRMLVFALLLAVAGGAAACGSGSDNEATTASASASDTSSGGDKPDIAVVHGSSSDPFWGAVQRGLEDAAKDFDVNMKLLPILNYDNYTPDMSRNFETAIGLQPDGIVAWTLVYDEFRKYVRQIQAKGIPLVEFNGGNADDGALGHVWGDDYQAGVLGGKVLAAAGKRHGMCVSNGNPVLAQRCRGFRASMQAAGGSSFDLNLPAAAQSNPAKMTQGIQGGLTSHPEADAIFNIGVLQAHGAVKAVENLGKTGEVLVGTDDVDGLSLNLIKSGKLEYAISQSPYLQGYYSIQILAQYLRYGFAPGKPVITGPVLIDRSSVDKALATNSRYPGILGGS